MFRLKVLFYLLVLLATSCIVQFDQCRDINRLKNQASIDGAPASLWYLAAKLGDAESISELGNYARLTSDPHWLEIAAELNSDEAIHTLALLSLSDSQQKKMFTKSAELGNAESQFELALMTDKASSKVFWLEKSASQGYQPAIIALHQWFLLHEEQQKALPWLEIASQFDANSGFIYARLLWRSSQFKAATAAFSKSSALGQRLAQTYLTHIREFWRKPLNDTRQLQDYFVIRSNCSIKIQIVALSLEGLVNATSFQQKFSQDNRLETLPICMNAPVLADPKDVTCDKHWQGQKRLGCAPLELETLVEKAEFSHLVVIAEQGKANVNNGIMFLDLADNYSVFIHELAHFAGFVDEYPLSTGLAENYCVVENAPNVVIAKEQENLELADMSEWLSSADEIVLSPARTCNNHSNQAFKPVREMTFMEFYDQSNIPDLYLRLWRQALMNPARLIPASVNFAQANEAANNPEKAALWWQAYRDYQLNQSH